MLVKVVRIDKDAAGCEVESIRTAPTCPLARDDSRAPSREERKAKKRKRGVL